MAITLTTRTIPEQVIKSGSEDALEVVAGKSLKIETSPDGIDILDEEVPAGKVWVVTISVQIKESDV